MILKNTYGLTTILSDRCMKKQMIVRKFAGSSLNRPKKTKSVTIRELHKQACEENDRKEYYKKTAHLRTIGYDAFANNEIEHTCSFEEQKSSETIKNDLLEEECDEFTTADQNIASTLIRYSSFTENIHELDSTPTASPNKKLRSMSQRTKQKIKKKVIAFSQVYDKLTFLTLTFVNEVQDKQAVKLLAKFLDNCTKQMKDFQYIWVAERQTKNETFKDNIHFHLITNKYFKINKYWGYWVKLQQKANITPRNENFKASSAFDIKRINAKNIKALGQYVTKYVTKNKDQFDCQVWNCSKKVSMLYTDFYSDYSFIENVEKILEYDLESIPAEYCTVYPVPLNRKTLPMYEKLNMKNREMLRK